MQPCAVDESSINFSAAGGRFYFFSSIAKIFKRSISLHFCQISQAIMSTKSPPAGSDSENQTLPNLPANVCIFSPKKPSAVEALLSARVFTRLVASASTTPEKLAAIKKYPGVQEDFCLIHRNAVLIFDGAPGEQDASVEDLHHEHFRVICLALKEYDIGLDVAGCIHDAADVLGAGFQLDKLNDRSALVIDLVVEEDSDDEDSTT